MGKKNPQEVFDYFAELDIRSPQVQKYLEKTNSREYPFMDQLSNSLIEGLMHADSSGSLGDFQIEQISKAIDFFKENHPAKAGSLMREFSKRVVKNKDPEVLKEWIDHYDDPRSGRSRRQSHRERHLRQRPRIRGEIRHVAKRSRSKKTRPLGGFRQACRWRKRT